jgi:hypothetical protein
MTATITITPMMTKLLSRFCGLLPALIAAFL